MDCSDEFLAYLELKQDLLFHKIPEKKLPYYINRSLEIGRELAAAFMGMSATKLLTQHQVNIKLEEGAGDFFKVKFRAQFESDSKGNNQITLYKQSVEEMAFSNQLSYESMEEIILMHEFFHYLEQKHSVETAEQLESIQTFHFLGVSRNAHIQRTSEIAANSFAKTVLQLPKLPNFYDYTYLLKTGKLTEQELLEEEACFRSVFDLEVKQ
ncbi:hypothetical protein GIX45_11665 [Erwinia sp. CPCC 100877]|nr:hypothetical protein [Erwinia sp. CPCC 100877]